MGTRVQQNEKSTTLSTPQKASAAGENGEADIPKGNKRTTSVSDIVVTLSFILVAVIAVIAGKFPAETGNVFQTTKGLIMSALAGSSSSSVAPVKRIIKVDPNPPHNIAVPTAGLIGPSTSKKTKVTSQLKEEKPVKPAYFRPNVLTDSINPPVTPPHGSDKIGLFLYANGFSDDPINVVVSKDTLCTSRDSLAKTLSEEVTENYICNGGCRAFLHNGWEVSSCVEIVENDKLWLVQPNREFMWPTFRKGHLVEVNHVETGNQAPIIVETLSESPKVFRLNNFFTAQEADNLIENALALTDISNRLHRSTTGQGDAAQQDSHRTSDNAWDMTSPTAMLLKRRIFDLLGIRPYSDSWADGIQVLRYNTTQAYNTHFDYLDFTPGARLDSAAGGHNRLATVVVYLTDVEEGGETVFPEGQAADGSDRSHAEVLEELKDKGYDLQSIGIKPGSWEERLVVQCRSKLSVRPKKAEAVLFYDQHPDGRQDMAALHGGCPVISGTKWAANLWIWNGPVHGDDNAPAGGKAVEPKDTNHIVAEFTSTEPGYSLYWKDTFFSVLIPDEPVRMNTFEGHVFNIVEGDGRSNKGEVVETFVIGPNDGAEQSFVFMGEE